jgi:hypothetical protein
MSCAQLVRRQVIAHLQIRHPNILPLLGVTSGADHPLSVITPFAGQGHALQFLLGMDRGDRASVLLRIVGGAIFYQRAQAAYPSTRRVSARRPPFTIFTPLNHPSSMATCTL